MNSMTLKLRCENAEEQPTIEVRQLQMQIRINGRDFVITSESKQTPTSDVLPMETSTSLPSGFWTAYDSFISERKQTNCWMKATYDKFEVLKNLLLSFRPETSFNDFDTAGLNDFIHFLCTTKNMCNSTITNQLGLLKWFLRWSFKKGFHSHKDFESFNPKLRHTKQKVIFLAWNELNRIKQCHIPQNKQYLERVRDIFLFCCFTGLRYSDVFNLKRSDIKSNKIEITTIKTAVNIIIELNDQSRAILNKYKKFVFSDNKALPVISNQRMNAYLKELGKLAALNEPVRRTYFKGNRRIDEVVPKYQLLATHVGRRTFVCNALSLGIPPEVVMKWTGHSDYGAMKPYIDIADKVKASAMRRFNRLTNGIEQTASDGRQQVATEHAIKTDSTE